ncbi:hypothetical protein MMC15_001225 [Xylographa vitiligo]|nr:hypothetical protein [Xylographa vitiligo]
MGLPVVGLLVKLVGGGIGLATEADAARKKRSSCELAESAQQPFTSVANEKPDDSPPPYTEQYLELALDHAEESVFKGHALVARDPESNRSLPHRLQSDFAVRSYDPVDRFSDCSLAASNTNGKFNHDIAKAHRKQAKRERKAIRHEEKHARRRGHHERYGD